VASTLTTRPPRSPAAARDPAPTGSVSRGTPPAKVAAQEVSQEQRDSRNRSGSDSHPASARKASGWRGARRKRHLGSHPVYNKPERQNHVSHPALGTEKSDASAGGARPMGQANEPGQWTTLVTPPSGPRIRMRARGAPQRGLGQRAWPMDHVSHPPSEPRNRTRAQEVHAQWGRSMGQVNGPR
jgi:hypothetical protein